MVSCCQRIYSKVDVPPRKPGSYGGTRFGHWQSSVRTVAEVAQGRCKDMIMHLVMVRLQVDTENARIGGEETDATQSGYQATQAGRFAAAWEPKPSRALYISLTDGFHKVNTNTNLKNLMRTCKIMIKGEGAGNGAAVTDA